MAENEASQNVRDAITVEFDKAQEILQCSDDGVDVSAFNLFQEGAIGDKIKSYEKKDESAAKKILLYIPRAIAALFSTLFSVENKKKITEFKDAEIKIVVDKKDENKIKKFFKSKPVKITREALLIGGFGVSAFNALKNSIKTKTETNDIQKITNESNAKRTKLNENFGYWVDVRVTDDNVLEIASSINMKKCANFAPNYLADKISAINDCAKKISGMKHTTDILLELQKLNAILISDFSAYDAIYDADLVENPVYVPYKEFYRNLSNCLATFDMSNDKKDIGMRKKLTDSISELTNAVPSKEVLNKGVLNKINNTQLEKGIDEMRKEKGISGPENEKVVDKIYEFINQNVTTCTHIAEHDIHLVFSNVYNLLKVIRATNNQLKASDKKPEDK